MKEIDEPKNTPNAEKGLWRYVTGAHSQRGKSDARELLEALPTARVELTPKGYRVWAGACDKPR